MVAKGEGWGERQGVCHGHVHTGLFKMDNQQGQETLPNVTWQLGWDGSLGENGYKYLYD